MGNAKVYFTNMRAKAGESLLKKVETADEASRI